MKLLTFAILLTLACGAKVNGAPPKPADATSPGPVTVPSSQPADK